MSIDRRETKRGTVYDVRLRSPEGRAYKRTFRTRKEAVDFEASELNRRARGEWVDLRAGRVLLTDFAERWLANRPGLRLRTRELYGGILRKHIAPRLGAVQVGQLRVSDVRDWYSGLLGDGVGPVTAAKAYRLLRAMLNTAVEDGMIIKNPCSIRSAGVERSPERPTASIAQVEALADAVPGRYRAMVLLAAFCGLRLGELLALRRDRIDLERQVVIVTDSLLELSNGLIELGPPKTEASVRSVSLPPHLVPIIAEHLEQFVSGDPAAIVFPGAKGGWMRRSQWNKYWLKAAAEVGTPGLRFHDMRHTGNTLAASTGASTRELMKRLGQSSPKAALRYQHATEDRDREIATALSELAARNGCGTERTQADSDGSSQLTV
jgi:integrase